MTNYCEGHDLLQPQAQQF